MFRTVPLSFIRSFSLYTQQWCMSYRFCWQFASRIRMELRPDPARKLASKPIWHIPLLCVQWKTPDEGQRKCPKHVEFYSKNKFKKLVHLVVFIIGMYYIILSSFTAEYWTDVLHCNEYLCRIILSSFSSEYSADKLLCIEQLLYSKMWRRTLAY